MPVTTMTASAAEIKQAYFTQVRAHPPERDPEAFKRILKRQGVNKFVAKSTLGLMLNHWIPEFSRAEKLELRGIVKQVWNELLE